MNSSIVQRAQERPDLLTAPDVGALQRTIGNRAVQTLLNRQSRGQTAPQRIQRVSDDAGNLDTYLENHHVSSIFKEYAGQNFVMESFDFLQAVRHYRKKPSLAMAEEIYARYIHKDAPQMVNLPGQLSSQARAAIDQAASDIANMKKSQQKEERLRNIFDPQYENIRVMVAGDVMPRFKKSAHYEKANKKLENVKSMNWFSRAISWRKGVKAKRGAYGAMKDGYTDKWIGKR